MRKCATLYANQMCWDLNWKFHMHLLTDHLIMIQTASDLLTVSHSEGILSGNFCFQHAQIQQGKLSLLTIKADCALLWVTEFIMLWFLLQNVCVCVITYMHATCVSRYTCTFATMEARRTFLRHYPCFGLVLWTSGVGCPAFLSVYLVWVLDKVTYCSWHENLHYATLTVSFRVLPVSASPGLEWQAHDTTPG